MIRLLETSFEKRKIEKIGKSSLLKRTTWKTINELTSRKSNKTVINEIQYQGQKSKSQVDVAELF